MSKEKVDPSKDLDFVDYSMNFCVFDHLLAGDTEKCWIFFEWVVGRGPGRNPVTFGVDQDPEEDELSGSR